MNRKKRRSNVTLQDLADKAGCSRNTASLAMRDSPRISEKTRKRIQAIARKLGYVPNLAARNLITSRSGLVGVVMNRIRDAVRSHLAEQLLTYLHTSQYRPILGISSDYPRRGGENSPWGQTFRSLNVEAIVVVCEAWADAPALSGIPHVLVGNVPDPALEVDYVALDRNEASRLAAEHLLARGHQRILITGERDTALSCAAIEAIRSAGREALVFDYDWPEPEYYLQKILATILNQPKRPSAVFIPDSPKAVEFLHLLHQTPLRCPEDLAVIAYDYFPWADMLDVPLTTIEQPIETLAREAIRLVQNRLANPESPFEKIALPHRLAVRKST